MCKKWIFVFCWMSWVIVGSCALNPFPKKTKKYNLSICAIFKNEKKHLKEWIEYHRAVGVDHFYLYNNNSKDQPLDVLRPYIRSGIVTLTNWPDYIKEPLPETQTFIWVLGTQIPAYQNAAKIAAIHETQWLTFLDVDEFLIPVESNSLTEILEKYKDAPGVILTREYFDASPSKVFPQKKLVIQSVALTLEPLQNIQRKIEKMIFKPELCEMFTWMPFKCVFKNKQPAVQLPKQVMRVNNYQNRDQKYYDPRLVKDRVKIDNTVFMAETKALLEYGYEIEDEERAIFQFIPAVLDKMGD